VLLAMPSNRSIAAEYIIMSPMPPPNSVVFSQLIHSYFDFPSLVVWKEPNVPFSTSAILLAIVSSCLLGLGEVPLSTDRTAHEVS